MLALMPFDPLDPRYTRFVRAVFAYTGEDAFPVNRLGSGTVIACEGDFYMLTARHVLTNQGADPTSIMVSFPESGEQYWPAIGCLHLMAASGFEADDAYSDIAIYKLRSTRDLRSFISDNDFLPFPVEQKFSAGAPLYAFGFPDEACSFDPEGHRYNHIVTSAGFEGHYEGATPYRGLHTFSSSVLLPSQNGMSGGCVTCLDTSRVGRHLFAGLIVQGGGQRLQFIDARSVIGALNFSLPDLRKMPSYDAE